MRLSTRMSASILSCVAVFFVVAAGIVAALPTGLTIVSTEDLLEGVFDTFKDYSSDVPANEAERLGHDKAMVLFNEAQSKRDVEVFRWIAASSLVLNGLAAGAGAVFVRRKCVAPQPPAV